MCFQHSASELQPNSGAVRSDITVCTGTKSYSSDQLQFFNVQCRSNELLSRFHLLGCGTNQAQYEFKCLAINDPMTCTVVYNDWTDSGWSSNNGVWQLNYLDRQDVGSKCFANEALQQFQLEVDTANNNHNLRYRYTCCTVSPYPTLMPTVQPTRAPIAARPLLETPKYNGIIFDTILFLSCCASTLLIFYSEYCS